MRRVLLTLALLGLVAGGANADPALLDDGVLIAHHVPGLAWTTDPAPVTGDWCAEFGEHAIGALGDVIAQIDVATYAPVVWYVVAAWEQEDKTWCGTEFGFGDFDAGLFAFVGTFPCFPVDGLEIPTGGWPGPNEGTAFVVTGDPWMGNWVPVYFFGGYAYGYGSSTVIPLAADPPTGFAGFGNCAAPPQQFNVEGEQLGAMGVNTPGVVPVFPVPPERWACCFDDGHCEMWAEQECYLMGGYLWLEGLTCDPNPCPQPGACCMGGLCEVLFEEECGLIGGEWLGAGTVCEPNPCPAVCCYGDTLHECMITLEEECASLNGAWHPEWTSCEPNPCDMYTPTEKASWGTIKSMYR